MRKILSVILFPVLFGCGSISGITIETPQERLVVIEYSYQAALKTIDRLIDTGVIKSGEDVNKISEIIVAANSSMKAARTAVALGSSDSITLVIIANEFVLRLIDYLVAKEREEVTWEIYSWPYKPSPVYYPQLKQLVIQ